MPPRYAYWTILIDQKATAFRAREREELLPTFHQLKRKNADVVMKWFARGRLWESPEEAQAAQRAPKAPVEKRGHAWRPGGEHRDPRDRFKKRPQAHAPKAEPWRGREDPGAPRAARPWAAKPKSWPARSDRPRGGKPFGKSFGKPSGERPRGAGGKPPRRMSGTPSAPPGPPPAERIRTKPKPPEID